MAAVALGIAIVLGATHVLVMPQWRYRVHRWEITPSAVYTRTGWLNQKRRIAALSRIQTVDTERGPIEQLFKLANVTVTTASAAGPLRIHGLELKTADQLVEALTAATGRNTGDAT
jgi:membrane protein YdbS with pleckstrin-like domain